MKRNKLYQSIHCTPTLAVFLATAISSSPLFAAEEQRRIEEVIVTAERREASVQDTSISITAFSADFLDSFGIRNQSDLQNFIPATTIQPYDATVRGVGRNFRNLGGDPGISTYMNGVYSEDLYTATVGGGFWDVERIEVLRGPQGTLYGRNAVGGAMNFLYKKPSDEFEAAFKSVAGNLDTTEVYGMVSGPIIPDVLSARVTGAYRERDGVVDNIGIGSDLDSLDETNTTVSLKYTPTDDLEFNVRVNRAVVDRIMGGAGNDGLVVLSEQGTSQRNFTDQVFSFRPIDRNQTNVLANDFFVPNAPVRTFADPATGAAIEAQAVRPGIDPAIGSTVGRMNNAFGVDRNPTQCVFSSKSNIDGDDVCSDTNGFNREEFDQRAVQFETSWQAADQLSIKYIFGYNDLLYERFTDDDLTSSLDSDRQFFVDHEAEYQSHELQFFYDVNDRLSFTTGLFYYEAQITQRGDFFSSVNESRFANAAPGSTAIFGSAAPDLFSARRASNGQKDVTSVAVGPWLGGSAAQQPGRPNRPASDLLYWTDTEREALAFYTQGVYDISEKWTATVGIRYARDDLDGEENLWRYTEQVLVLPNDAAASPIGLSLLEWNVGIGALDPNTLQPTGAAPLAVAGVPLTLNVHRRLSRRDEEVTWRVNFDYTPTANQLLYLSATKGHRAGGFNLVFFSQTAEYDPEELISYEFGYKSQFFNNTLQLNGSVYLYDYESIHTFAAEPSIAGGTSTSVLAAPGAEVIGIEGEVTWLASNRLTLGGNFSYTPNEYDEDFFLLDTADPDRPVSLFTPISFDPAAEENPNQALLQNIEGNQLLQVPDWKFTAWGSYMLPISGGNNIELLTSYSWIDETYSSPFEKEIDRAPAYGRWDARATWQSRGGRWGASVYINNILDELGIREIGRTGEEEGFRRAAQLTERRLYGLELSLNFGQ
ncbi:MAG: TonB-dependent receptor [Pseudomonadales bacterium]|nr:TonB-dependent receptor [Pseudomonadales bacterium]